MSRQDQYLRLYLAGMCHVEWSSSSDLIRLARAGTTVVGTDLTRLTKDT